MNTSENIHSTRVNQKDKSATTLTRTFNITTLPTSTLNNVATIFIFLHLFAFELRAYMEQQYGKNLILIASI